MAHWLRGSITFGGAAGPAGTTTRSPSAFFALAHVSSIAASQLRWNATHASSLTVRSLKPRCSPSHIKCSRSEESNGGSDEGRFLAINSLRTDLALNLNRAEGRSTSAKKKSCGPSVECRFYPRWNASFLTCPWHVPKCRKRTPCEIALTRRITAPSYLSICR